MKIKPRFIAAFMLALFALTACSGKKTDAAQKMDTDATPDSLIEAAENNSVAEAHQPIADAEPVEESVISNPAPAVGKTAAVTENLRLRTDDNRTAEVVATLAAVTHVEILAVGREDTIDGIASNWVRVAVLGGATDMDGNAVAVDTQGWLFGGYLSDVEKYVLVRAAEYEDIAEVRRLIAAGADVNAKDNYGYTALMWAARNNDTDMAELLLAAGADVNAKNNYGNTALILVTKENSVDIARLLLAAGADADAKGRNGSTALMQAAKYNSVDTLELLLAAGADVNTQNKYGKTALMFAADYDSADAAEILLAAGADVNTKDNDGMTALMYAALFNSADIAKVLLAAGANLNITDNRGWTARRLADRHKTPDVAELLEAAGAQ